ncbi:Spectrin alpha chain isoform X4 [Oopsacas minuta]|uniref:Spectrin alpha chain isoform X4 n=1 Tax=Oopsacas minuta TaxID=111878 RepID=A0AAV7KK94_9METZ|nr:Spectrin alpha chain isoform X4 [Oopsacas minuta]
MPFRCILELFNFFNRFDELYNLFGHRKSKLIKDLNILRYLRSLEQEESWLRDKRLLTAVEDFGKDLIGVQRLEKKHQRFELELVSHENTIHRLVSQCNTLDICEKSDENISIIQEKCRDVNLSLIELKSNAITRTRLLDESERYQQLSANFQEEDTWLIENFNAILIEENVESLELLQDSLSQFETFSSDFQVSMYSCFLD